MENLTWHQQNKRRRDYRLRNHAAHIQSASYYTTGLMLCGRKDTPVTVDPNHRHNPANKTCATCCRAADRLAFAELLRLYPWVRLRKQGNYKIACGGIFYPSAISVGQYWVGSSGGVVKVIQATDTAVTYAWLDSLGKLVTHEKAPFAFQCRYCLILNPSLCPPIITVP